MLCMTENDIQLEEMCAEKCVWQQQEDRKLDLSHLFLPSRREEGSSVISIFFLLLHFHLNLIVGVFLFFVFLLFTQKTSEGCHPTPSPPRLKAPTTPTHLEEEW